MFCGEEMVAQWTNKDWWKSVISSSDSASIQKRVLLHLTEFLFCVKVLTLIASNHGSLDGRFVRPDVDLMFKIDLLTPDVEKASQRDIEFLLGSVEAYRRRLFPKRDGIKLAEYVLNKAVLSTNSDHGHLRFIDYDDVKLGDFLGKGSFGAVFKCEFLGEKAAAKVFTASRRTEVDIVQKEARLQARLQHPNVVQFIGYAAKESQHMIVSELMSKDLRSYLDETVHKGQTRPPLSLLLDIMLQIAEPMKYLHENGMMHRDLKANNILINVVESKELCISPSVQVKLTDFGFSKLNLVDSRFTSPQTGGTLWRAPEVFEDKQNIEKYTKAADVYSYAMVFFEVLTGNTPWFDAEGNPTVRMSDLLPSIRRGERPTLPPDCPAHLSAFISKCWATRPQDRPKFPEICKFLWQCKGQILTCSYPDPSPQSSTPQKHTNDGG
jgi:hypothetical protein